MKVIKPNSLAPADGTFTRASSATYFTADKVLTTVANNIPRFNYNPTDGQFDGLLIETASTNLLTYSSEFNNVAWGTTGSSIAADTSTAPTGTSVADTITNTTGNPSLVGQLCTVSASATNDYFFSVFVKKGTTEKVTLNAYYIGNAESNVTFDLDNFTVSGALPYADDYIFYDVGNGFYRCGYRLARDATGTRTSVNSRIWVGERGSGAIGQTLILFGAQLELGTAATSYIPTTTASVTRAADTVAGSGLIYTTVTDPNAPWLSTTGYILGAKVRYNYRIYESLQGSNLNNIPSASPLYWLDIGPDNQHAAFDTQISTVSTATTSMTFVLKMGLFDSLALINMSAVTARITIYSPANNAYVRLVSGLSGLAVYDWYQYFFYDPLIKRTQVTFTGIPAYADSVLTVELSGNPGDIVSVAQAIFGMAENLGGTQYGATSGIVDYSLKSTDDFGTVTFVKRNFSKRLSAQVYLDNAVLNRVQRFLYEIRATPVVWIGADDPQLEEALVVYGFYKEFSVDIAYTRNSLCSLEIEGLT